jgi:hypothetical protein
MSVGEVNEECRRHLDGKLAFAEANQHGESHS